MNNIDYSWEENQSSDINLTPEVEENSQKQSEDETLQTRHNIQIMRRLFHMFNGFAFATLYFITFSHSQMVHLLGTFACVLYLVEQIRINYPETASKLLPFTKFIMRAEEQLKESAMMPYAMAVLLTIITFPKEIALVGIYALAFSDPLSAIVGIKYGKHKISPTRSVEGSLAYFVTTFLSSLIVLKIFYPAQTGLVLLISTLLGIFGTFFDLIPLKVDDNLTIPLFTSLALWVLMTLFGIY